MLWRVKKNINNKSKNKDAVKDSNIGNIIGFPAISYKQYNSYLIEPIIVKLVLNGIRSVIKILIGKNGFPGSIQQNQYLSELVLN